MRCSLAPQNIRFALQNIRFALQLCLLPLISHSPILFLSIYSIIASPYCSSFSHTCPSLSLPWPPVLHLILHPYLLPSSPNFLLCVPLIHPIIVSLLFLFSYTRHFPSLPRLSLPSPVPPCIPPCISSIPASGRTLFFPASTQFERCVQDVLSQWMPTSYKTWPATRAIETRVLSWQQGHLYSCLGVSVLSCWVGRTG